MCVCLRKSKPGIHPAGNHTFSPSYSGAFYDKSNGGVLCVNNNRLLLTCDGSADFIFMKSAQK